MSSPGKADDSRDKRPITERWWWLFLVTAWAWLRLPGLAYDLIKGNEVDGFDWIALGALAVFMPAFVWLRRREERKRSVARSDRE